ncbi:PAS domain S-box protein [Desulfomicrobium norvegicum]|uniref:PAS domain S-box protein n=1 Tax=Desulfomicrobium norvegicum (strain DSM 1741 / NCIMB 8310) TaxID=52561 RepID=UPI000B85045D|nr:PAS domain S-box protein [Desulfomicrobium norvegicum]
MKKQPEEGVTGAASLRDKIVGLSESSGRKSYYPMLQQKIRELQGEIADRHRAEETLRETLKRIERQQAVIAEISTHPTVFHGLLQEAAPMITARMTHAMDVARASLWMMQADRLCCMDKFDAPGGAHTSGTCLECGRFDTYFEAIKKGPVIVTDALQDPRTRDFSPKYLEANGIASMLDVPVLIDGELTAVICFEHVGEPRDWQPDEVTFASRIADQVALILAGQRRRITEEQLQSAHADLTRNLRFTEVLLDAIPIPIFYKDSERRYLGCNQTFTDIMGITSEELRGRTARELWPDLADAYDNNDQSLRQDTRKSTYESKVRDRNGDLREVIFAKQIFFDELKNAQGIIGSFVDITERNRAAKETQRLRTLLANIINSMPSMLIGVDADGRIAQWNQQAALVTGVSEAQAQGRPLGQVVPWLGSGMKKIRQSIASKKPLFEGKLSRVEHGETMYEDVTIYPLITNGVEGAVIRIDDVTEKVRIEEILIQSEKMLSVGGLAAGMAHEINNPLASIMGNAQVLETRLLLPLPQNELAAQEAGITLEALQSYLEKRGIPKMLNSVRSSGAQAAQIVSNMLSFSRKSEPVLAPENIVELLGKTLELARTDYDLKKNYDFKKIRIVREYEDNLPKIQGSASKLQQVFLNLLRNGAEAMGDKIYPAEQWPQFTLRVRRNAPWVRIELEDNGPGLSESVRKRVFEPFFTTKSVGKGTGLGLSVSYFIITEEHAGMMAVQTAEGEWTRFIIDLPVAMSSK